MPDTPLDIEAIRARHAADEGDDERGISRRPTPTAPRSWPTVTPLAAGDRMERQRDDAEEEVALLRVALDAAIAIKFCASDQEQAAAVLALLRARLAPPTP